MENLTLKLVNVETGEENERKMNANELAKLETDKAEGEAQEAAQEAKEQSRQSALEKLAALGLTPEEIAAITGA